MGVFAVLALGQLWHIRRTKNLILFCLFLQIALMHAYAALFFGEYFLKSPHLFMTGNLLAFPAAGLYYLYILSLTERGFTFRKRHFFILLIPTLIAAAMLTPVWLYSVDEKIRLYTLLLHKDALYPPGEPNHLFFYFAILIGLNLTVFATLSVTQALKAWRKSQTVWYKNVYAFLTIWIFIYIFVDAHGFYSLYLNSLSSFGLTMSLAAANVIMLIVFNQAFPNLLLPEKMVKNEGRRKSLLTSVNVKNLEEKLKQLVKEEKIFSDNALTLRDLAKELGLNAHQASEFFNQYLGKNFSDYMNECRIEEAKVLLKEKLDLPILTIALQVGFNSESYFHNIFTRKVGKSPGSFRKG